MTKIYYIYISSRVSDRVVKGGGKAKGRGGNGGRELKGSDGDHLRCSPRVIVALVVIIQRTLGRNQCKVTFLRPAKLLCFLRQPPAPDSTSSDGAHLESMM